MISIVFAPFVGFGGAEGEPSDERWASAVLMESYNPFRGEFPVDASDLSDEG